MAEISGYCLKCKTYGPIKDGKLVKMKNGRVRMGGFCSQPGCNGKISKIGSVVLSERLVVEKYSHVMHLVSEVEGHLRDGLSFMDVLKATFPAGTLSGAPKIRAMEIIEELEPERRSLYGGACGYISFAKDMDLAIAIRTGVLKNGILSVQAGAGIVYDSIPENEWRETEAKVGAVIKAAESLENNKKFVK